MSGAVQALIGSLAGVVKDAFWSSVTLLLPGNGTNGAQNNTFIDGSTNNFTITRNGNTTQGTFTPYGSNWSNYFDGTGDAVKAANNAAFSFGTGDLTLEAWVYLTAYPAVFGTIIGQPQTSATAGNTVTIGMNSSGAAQFYAAQSTGAYVVSLTAGTIPLNTWTHIAGVRNGSSWNLYVNGTSGANTTQSPTLTQDAGAGGIEVGGSPYFANYYVTGYISSARVVKGTAVYTANFTPPTSPLTAITNTSLLTCQSNRFIDNSTNAFAITRNGDVSVQRFSPFSPTAAYSTSVIGGSGYFDGTGDYLTVADNAALEIGASSFCIEGWIYLPSLPSSGNRYAVLGKWTLGQYSYIFNVYNNSGTMQLELFYSTNGSTASSIVENAAITAGTWHHIAITRDSTTCRFFLNGTQQGSNQTVSATFYNGTAAVDVGRHGDNINYLPGYISSCRLVIGTAVYTSNFTPSTTPLTAITNTSLLLNFTNAGIIDNAMMNDLETVGNAQISTAQSKFGGSSIAFDGTGDYLVSNSDANNYAFGSGDFTIEMWLYLSTTAGTQIFYDARPTSTQGAYVVLYVLSGTVGLYVNSADRIVGSSLSATTWYHIALARSGTSTKLFVDGVQVGSTYTDTNSYLNPAQRPIIGAQAFSAGLTPLNGYIDDLRITKGVARYTANFTPPAAAFPTS